MSSWSRCSAPATTRRSASSTTATGSDCSPTRARCFRGGQDAEDALQDVFVRAYSGLRSSDRELALRAWLFRVAHNRCIDELRRPAAAALRGAPARRAGRSRSGRRGRAARVAAAADRRRPPAPRSAALGAADARDGWHVLRRARGALGDVGAGRQVAAGARARVGARAGARGARHGLLADPGRARRRPRPRRASQRDRQAPHARLRRVPELRARAAHGQPPGRGALPRSDRSAILAKTLGFGRCGREQRRDRGERRRRDGRRRRRRGRRGGRRQRAFASGAIVRRLRPRGDAAGGGGGDRRRRGRDLRPAGAPARAAGRGREGSRDAGVPGLSSAAQTFGNQEAASSAVGVSLLAQSKEAAVAAVTQATAPPKAHHKPAHSSPPPRASG